MFELILSFALTFYAPQPSGFYCACQDVYVDSFKDCSCAAPEPADGNDDYSNPTDRSCKFGGCE